ncbi:MAG: DUF1003 domain-containing protein [Propionibacteriales bacterium]|nr:DUF1003 domain-containing protein [Propionibacteriales bacterium]
MCSTTCCPTTGGSATGGPAVARDDRIEEARDEERRRRSSRRARLDQPRDLRRASLFRPQYDPEVFGQLSERVARFLGTGRFLVYMTAFIIIWVVWNLLLPGDVRWDFYPFIFLTLMLSLQASYAAPLILLAQNRQEGRDRVNLEQDRDANARAHADMEFLAREVASLRLAMGEVATRDYLRSELRSLLADLDERASAAPDEGDDAGRRSLEP